MDVSGKNRYDLRLIFSNAPVAQLDRVLVSEAKGHRFESCRAHHSDTKPGTPKSRVPGFCFETAAASCNRSKLALILDLQPS